MDEWLWIGELNEQQVNKDSFYSFMTNLPTHIDVLCVGHASYDLVFSVAHHPAEDEKMVAEGFVSCGGGPAANAAVTVAKLGFKAAFSGYLCLLYTSDAADE